MRWSSELVRVDDPSLVSFHHPRGLTLLDNST
jgi:hypothetical protein